MKERITRWLHSAAGRISIILIIASALLLRLACSHIGAGFMTERAAELANNILIGVATNLLGIVITVSFVQYFIDKQDEKNERREEAEKILRYHKYMQTLIRRYLMFYMSVTTRLKDRNGAADIDSAFTRTFKLQYLSNDFTV